MALTIMLLLWLERVGGLGVDGEVLQPLVQGVVLRGEDTHARAAVETRRRRVSGLTY